MLFRARVEAWAGCEEFGGSAMGRRGRKRKAGHRTRSGRLVHDPRLSPAAIAATMPHRHALGEKAVDQLAESELGRLALGDRRGGLCAALAGVHREPLCSQSPLARRRQQRLKDGRGAGLENAVSEYCRHFCSG